MVKLNHKSLYLAVENSVFDSVNSISEMEKSIIQKSKKYSNGVDMLDSEEELTVGHNLYDAFKFKGDMMEVFAEFLISEYGRDSRIGVINPFIPEYDIGVDFLCEDLNSQQSTIQIKFRSNPRHQFKKKELDSFMSTAANKYRCFEENQVLISNAEYIDGDTNLIVNHNILDINPKIKIIDGGILRLICDNNLFWNEFRESLKENYTPPTLRTKHSNFNFQNDCMTSIIENL